MIIENTFKKVFTIKVDDMTIEEAEKRIAELMRDIDWDSRVEVRKERKIKLEHLYEKYKNI